MINVAIDGPAGAGKSTIAKAAAKELGFIYVDTGALYRAVAYNAVKNGVIDDEQGIISMLDDTKVELKYVEGVQSVYLNGEDVSGFIRTPEISMGASKVSAIPQVREFLLNLQREIAKTNNVIMDGRDIATVVLPDAEVKIFLLLLLNAGQKEDIKNLWKRVRMSALMMFSKMSISVTIRTLTERLHRLNQAKNQLWQTLPNLLCRSQLI